MKAPNKVTPPRSGNQPGLTGTEKVYGSKKVRQIRVKLKGSTDKREFLVPFADFNPAVHAVVKG
jgi:hypothetical protein